MSESASLPTISITGAMASIPASPVSTTHLERTAHEPREQALHRVIVSSVYQVSEDIRLIQLQPVAGEPPIKFLPGQFLDVHIPSLPHAGGFSITSPPSALCPPTPYLELAIQHAPSNPHAVFLRRPAVELLGTELRVRVGGSFVWPPVLPPSGLARAVFVAGGIGINPLMSMLSHLADTVGQEEGGRLPFAVKILYSVRDPGQGRNSKEILFLGRLAAVVERLGDFDALELFLTPPRGEEPTDGMAVIGGEDGEALYRGRRIRGEDLERVLGPVEERDGTVVYVCGVPGMTEKLVRRAKKAEGMDERHVLHEKWW